MKEIKEVLLYSSQLLRGHIEYKQYQQNIIGAIFYKYLSNTIEKENNKKLFKYNINYTEAFQEENIEYYGQKIKKESMKELGYFIKPENLYNTIIKTEEITRNLDKAIKEIKFQDKTLENIFDNVTFESLNITDETKKIFIEILIEINQLTFQKDEYNRLMKYFLKKSYTPDEISTLLSKLATTHKKEIENAYDATIGSASTLLALQKEAKVKRFYGQEINKTNYNMARMNLIMHKIHPDNFKIYNEDSANTHRKLPPIDVVISHPPFLKKWEANEELLKDKRFNKYKKLPPKSKADYAFIETMIYPLSQDGIMAIVIPQGVLFRTNAEKDIRKTFLKEQNYIDAIIGLPEKTFHKNIPTCIIILRKNRQKDDKILFIDASREYDDTDNLNKLKKEDINKIVDTYKHKREINKYSYNATMKEIIENDYNLNIKRYVNSYEEREKIDINTSIKEMKELDEKIEKLKDTEDKLIKKLTKE